MGSKLASTVNAQSFQTIFTFVNTNGAFPQSGLTLGPDGNYYGTTYGGGIYYTGTVYQVNATGQISTIFSFNGTNGANPMGGLTLGNDGNLYGTTENGGFTNTSNANGLGTIFRITTNGLLTTLVQFNFTNGAHPWSTMTLGNDGYLYGTTANGGTNTAISNGAGTIYKLSSNGVFATIASITNGSYPYAGLVQNIDGLLYGTTYSGGAGSYGTAFKVTTNGQYSTIVLFTSTNEYPNALAAGANGLLYGTTQNGGSNFGGIAFTLTTNGVLSVVGSFPNGAHPIAGLSVGNDGNYYGTTTSNIFQITPSGVLNILAGYPTKLATSPRGALTLTGSGLFYGTAMSWGPQNVGVVFQTDTNGDISVINTFNGVYGASPRGLTLGPDGYLYGTTYGGGIGYGTAYKISTTGQQTNLAWFGMTNGANPNMSPTFGNDGCMYGTTSAGGLNGAVPSQGTVYKITTNGYLSTIVSFNTSSNGAGPKASLTIAKDGSLYGTTMYSGYEEFNSLGQLYYEDVGYGTVFKITTNYSFSILTSSFGYYADYPESPLTFGADGNYYGTAETSVSSYNGGYGSVFKMTTNFSITTYWPFHNTNGCNPNTPMSVGLDGNLYGTTFYGGITNGSPYPSVSGFGVVYKISTNGSFSELAAFNQTNNGQGPSQLLLASDGLFYGTTEVGGSGLPSQATPGGTIFSINTNGFLTTLYFFNPTNGFYPGTGLTYGSDGYFYGTTLSGMSNSGTVFRFAVPPAIIQQPASSSNIIGAAATFSVAAQCPNPVFYQWQVSGTNIFNGSKYSGANSNVFVVNNASSSDDGSYSVIVSNIAGSVTSSNATLNLVFTPFIVTQPQSQSVAVGNSATLSVTAICTTAFTYQWLLNGTSIPGATNFEYTVTNAQMTNGGYYSVSMSNSYGNTISAPAELTALQIVQQPSNITVTNSGAASFSVGATGTGPLIYQWQFDGSNMPPIISTVGGNGSTAYVADGILATTTGLSSPLGVQVDNTGNVYVADTSGNRVCRIGTNGLIVTVAGSNQSGASGNNGPATNALLHSPSGVAIDGAGNIYIADTLNNLLRKVNTNGIITTVGGNGVAGFSGDAGLATSAELNQPYGVLCDAIGNVFFSDTHNNRIRKISTNGIITTVAGNGTAGYSGDGGQATNAAIYYPEGIAINSLGNIVFADSSNYRIRTIDGMGNISTIAGTGTNGFGGDGGPATSAKLSQPCGVGADAYGNIYIADSGNNRVRKIDTNNVINTFAGNGSISYIFLNPFGNIGDWWFPASASLDSPSGVCADNSGNVYIADTLDYRIRKTTPCTSPALQINSATTNCIGNFAAVVNGVVTSSVAGLFMPAYVMTQPQSKVVLAGGTASFSVTPGSTGPFTYQWYFNGAPVFGATTNLISLTNCSSSNDGAFTVAVSNVIGGASSPSAALTVAYIGQQPGNQSVAENGHAEFGFSLTSQGTFTYRWQFDGTNLPIGGIISTIAGNGTNGYGGDGGMATAAELSSPNGIAIDRQGNIFIADDDNDRIRKITTNGVITTLAGNGTGGYSGDGGLATNAELANPTGVAVDYNGDVFIADAGNQRVREVFTNGLISTIAGTGAVGFSGDGGQATNAEFWNPCAVALDSAGNIYVADQVYGHIRKIGTNGTITSVAGGSSSGYTGDGIPATNSSLWWPTGIAVDAAGNIYIADQINCRIRKVDTNGIIWTVAGNGLLGNSGNGGIATNATIGEPTAVTVDPFGKLYFSGTDNVREVFTNGIINTVAGTNITAGYNGDGGVATSATLSTPNGLAIDSNNDLLIADVGNQRIRKIVAIPTVLCYLPTLTLADATISNEGEYSVVITDSSGNTLTTAQAYLSVYLPLQAFVAIETNGAVQIHLSGTPGIPYSLQSTPSIIPPITWQPVITNLADTNGNWNYTITNLGIGPGYFRAVGQ